MSREAISGGQRRGQGQGAGSIKEVLNSLAFLDKPGAHIAREQLPRAAQSVEGLVHELQCFDEGHGRSAAAARRERQNGARSKRQVATRQCVARIIR